jgi:hypothetical protein
MNKSSGSTSTNQEKSSAAEASQEDFLMIEADAALSTTIPSSDNGGELHDLGINFVDQNVLERELMAKVWLTIGLYY